MDKQTTAARVSWKRLKRWSIAFVKLAIPASIFAYLLMQIKPEEYQAFWKQPKQWHILIIAQLTALSALVISFMRWRQLVLAFEIPFSVTEALRLGFLGYLFNFVSFGSVGGDVFKAILVARDKPEKRPEAVASVLLDRAIGLLGLVILAWISLIIFAQAEMPAILIGIRRAAGIVAIASITALLMAIYAGGWFDRLIDWGAGIPFAGETLARMARAIRLLRRRPAILFGILGAAVVIHTLLASTVYLVSVAVYGQHPTWSEHLMVVPPGMAAGALPLAPGGIGYQEGALAGLFELLPRLPDGYSGLLVATIYRLITLGIAGIGVIYYLASHGREFRLVRNAHTGEV